MKRLLTFSLLSATAVLAVGAAFVPGFRPRPEPGGPSPRSKRLAAARTEKKDAVTTLVAQLHRRFSDQRDVDFGFSRISRPKSRLHFGPTMDRNDLVWYTDEEKPPSFDKAYARRSSNGKTEIRAEDGTWIDFEEAKPQMRPENPTEREAMRTLVNARREIAIYTFGGFDATGPTRTRGPAYLRQKGPDAPEAETLKRAASVAWNGGTPTVDGFRLRAEKIFAERSCVRCHTEGDGYPEDADAKKVKVGEPLGLVLIAEKI